jgi:hypothetical protein
VEKWIKKIMQFGGLFLFMSCNQPVDVVTIDLSREEAEIPPSLYGIFFEEITHSGDGGLYAEMIRNRGFEDGTLPSGTVLKDGKAVAKPLHCYSNDSINHFSIAWNDSLFMEGWEVKCVSDTRPPFYEITEVKPLNNATPHALFIDLGASASDVWVMNDGYWGIAVTEGQRYNFQFYLFTEELKNTVVTAALLDREEQIVVSKNFQIKCDDPWNLVYTLSNRGEKALRGEIKAVWEREFKLKSNSYSPSTKKKGAVNDEEWKDEIGKDSVDIPTGTRFWKGIMSCKFPVKRLAPRHDGVKYAIPVLHLYWRAENSNEWILLRCDADYLFNCNYTGGYIWDETTNYVKVMPQSWH